MNNTPLHTNNVSSQVLSQRVIVNNVRSTAPVVKKITCAAKRSVSTASRRLTLVDAVKVIIKKLSVSSEVFTNLKHCVTEYDVNGALDMVRLCQQELSVIKPGRYVEVVNCKRTAYAKMKELRRAAESVRKKILKEKKKKCNKENVPLVVSEILATTFNSTNIPYSSSSTDLSDSKEIVVTSKPRVSLCIQLQKLGLMQYPVYGDGNCLFRALAHQLEGTDVNHMLHRGQVCDFMENNSVLYANIIPFSGFSRFVKSLRHSGKYGNELCINAFAHLHHVKVTLHQAGLLPIVYSYDNSSGRELHVIFHRVRKHYDSVVNIQSE